MIWDATAKTLTAYINGVPIGTTSGSGAFNTPDASNVSFGYLGRAVVVGRSIDGSLDSVGFAKFTGTFDSKTNFQLFTPKVYAYWAIDQATPGAGSDSPQWKLGGCQRVRQRDRQCRHDRLGRW